MRTYEGVLTHHQAFGLRLVATKPIPGLAASLHEHEPDVQVFLDGMPPWLDEMPGAAQHVWYVNPSRDERGEPILQVWKVAEGDYYRLLYGDGTQFLVDRSGSRVWASWPDMATLEDTTTYLLGPVFGFVLRLRGLVCLHASAVAVGDRAVALLGPAGAGKSTTAAIFARRGFSVLSDDVAALVEQGGQILVQPAYPRIRLWPESVAALYDSADALPRLTPTWDKRYMDLIEEGDRFQPRPLPLAAIYTLGERTTDPRAPFVEAVPSRDAMVNLIGNGYVNYLLDEAMRAHEFELLGRIVARIPFRRVNPHTDPSKMTELSDVILRDFRVTAPSSRIPVETRRG